MLQLPGRLTSKTLVPWKQIRSSWLCAGSSLFAAALRRSAQIKAQTSLRRLIRELNEEEIRRELHTHDVDWFKCVLPKCRFQPPTASHMSGVWERLIRSVRKAMNAILSKPGAAIPLETLRIVFSEVMSILNSRPISPASDDPSDMEPLTLQITCLYSDEISPYPSVSSLRRSCTRASNGDAQLLANCFWSRWVREYVPTLQQRHKWLPGSFGRQSCAEIPLVAGPRDESVSW